MDQSDKIFDQIKNAAIKQETADFPAMDKVWSRVESKLDQKVLKKENKLWKKIAVAASFLLVFTISYQIFQPKETVIIKNTQPFTAPPDQITTSIAKEETNPDLKIEESEASSKENSKTIKPSQERIMVVPAAEKMTAIAEISDESDAKKEMVNKDEKSDKDELKSYGYNNSRSESVSDMENLRRNDIEVAAAKAPAQSISDKNMPLLVVDGKAVTSKSNSKQTLQQGLSKLNPEEVEEIVVLKEPLYIINGHYYSEQELFGPNPTSPYYPLNQQEIESLSVLQGEKAIAVYGKKGEKGVVIISTKNGKPIKTPLRKE